MLSPRMAKAFLDRLSWPPTKAVFHHCRRSSAPDRYTTRTGALVRKRLRRLDQSNQKLLRGWDRSKESGAVISPRNVPGFQQGVLAALADAELLRHRSADSRIQARRRTPRFTNLSQPFCTVAGCVQPAGQHKQSPQLR